MYTNCKEKHQLMYVYVVKIYNKHPSLHYRFKNIATKCIFITNETKKS